MVIRLLLVLFVASLALVPPEAARAAPSDAQLAARWAPVHYQDTDSSDYDADYLSAVDFDGDWNAKNNWESQDDDVSDLKGTVYYSVAETATHWFLVYGFFHPRDWSDVPLDLLTHENDMEGVLLTVRKDGSTYGALEAMVTVAHADFLSYVAPGSPYTAGQHPVAGGIVMQQYGGYARPTTFQEAKGHGAYAWNGGGFPGDDGIVYYPSATTAEVPAGGNDRNVKYRLVNLLAGDGLWAHRDDPLTFIFFGVFRGDNGVDNAADAPWGWDTLDTLPSGRFAIDPAKLVATYFDGEGEFALTYTRNEYRKVVSFQ
jgi:hypothetical protein